MNNFNLLAPIYDRLAQLIFGPVLHEASVQFIEDIPSGSYVLMLGGGTGKLLPELRNCKVVYVEKSRKMIVQAQNQKELGWVDFNHGDFLRWKTSQKFDAVICPFFLDVFSDDNLKLALNKIHSLLKAEGQLIVTDFGKTQVWHHRFLLKVMHWFFGIFSSLESKQLKPIQAYLSSEGFQAIEEKTWSNGLIFSIKATIRESRIKRQATSLT